MDITRIAVRAGVTVLALSAIAWAATVLPVFWKQQNLVAISNALERGERYSAFALIGQLNTIQLVEKSDVCNAPALRGAVNVLVRILEDADVQQNRTLEESVRANAFSATRALLRCSPTEAFAWLVLFWLEINRNGYSPEYGGYLRLSYELAPNEAAVALWRNRLVISLGDRLPAGIAELAVGEFVKLVETERLYPEMAEIFQSASPGVREHLLQRLGGAKRRPREVFARYLRDNGISGAIPNSGSSPARPWN